MTKAPVQNHRHGHRDASIDALLRQTLRDGAGAVEAGPCLEADVLAAWADRSLPAADATSVEHHVAGCARCQAVAAGLARASAPVHEPAPGFWTRWQLGWLVPVAAAAALAVWVALPDRRAEPVLESVDSRLEPPAAPAELPEAPQASQPSEFAPRLADRADAESREAVGPPSTRPRTGAAKAERATSADAAGTGAEAPPAPAGVRQEVAGAATSVAVTGATPAAAAPAPAAPRDVAPPAPIAAPPLSPATPAPAAAREQSVSARAANGVTRARADDAGAPIAAPASAQRWRIVGGRRVERSLDAGGSWASASIQTAADLTAGASPGADVCWLVGRAGALFVTTDGVTFVRVTPPAAVDLTDVRPGDDRTAVVTTADGRAFRTTDRGATWQAAPR